MITRHHKVPGEEACRHAASSITEVRGWTDGREQFRGDGFYFWDETEAGETGPFGTLAIAIEQRDLYFKTLNRPNT